MQASMTNAAYPSLTELPNDEAIHIIAYIQGLNLTLASLWQAHPRWKSTRAALSASLAAA